MLNFPRTGKKLVGQLNNILVRKMTGETPEVRSDKRKPREKKRERERKREKTIGKEREKMFMVNYFQSAFNSQKNLNILAEMLEISKSGWIYSSTLSLQKLLSELTNCLGRFLPVVHPLIDGRYSSVSPLL